MTSKMPSMREALGLVLIGFAIGGIGGIIGTYVILGPHSAIVLGFVISAAWSPTSPQRPTILQFNTTAFPHWTFYTETFCKYQIGEQAYIRVEVRYNNPTSRLVTLYKAAEIGFYREVCSP